MSTRGHDVELWWADDDADGRPTGCLVEARPDQDWKAPLDRLPTGNKATSASSESTHEAGPVSLTPPKLLR